MKGYEDHKTGKTNQNCLVIIISKMKIKSLHRKESDCDDSHICRHICIYLSIYFYIRDFHEFQNCKVGLQSTYHIRVW